jgi:prevent-host-death family protein
MADIKVTDLRQNLPAYLAEVRRGTELRITSRGKVIARIVPERDAREAARRRLVGLRAKSRIGDILKPTGVQWDADRGGA